jgi:two-component system, NarL family, nitrate/nitrite response regulator NarL
MTGSDFKPVRVLSSTRTEMGAGVTLPQRTLDAHGIQDPGSPRASVPPTRVRKAHKLVIVDPHALVRRGFALSLGMLHPEAQIIEAASADEAVGLAERHGDLGLILMDVDSEGGVETLRALVDALGQVPVVAVSASEEPVHIVACVNAGARGYVLKASPSDVLEHVVSLVLADPGYLPLPRVALLRNAHRPPADNGANDVIERQLTERQRDVFRLLQLGYSNKEIARELGVLEGTVKVHVRAIMQKLGVRNRTQVAVLAVRGHVAD